MTHPSTWEAECKELRAENERLRGALDDLLEAHESGWIAGEDWGASDRARAALNPQEDAE